MNIYHEFLSRVLEATQKKRIEWTKNADGEFIGSGRISLVIRQIVPLVAGPTETIGPQAFEVLAANVMFTVWEGSECCTIVRDILAEAFPPWASQRDLIVQRLTNAIKLLD